MTHLKIKTCFLLVLIFGLGNVSLSVKAPKQKLILSRESIDNQSTPSGCTVITIAKGGNIFFGGNDDYIEADSYFWVEQGDSMKYGVIWIGTPDNPQQGVNEKLLAYDSNGLPRVDVNPHQERIPVTGEYHNYLMNIMHECATVEEVISWVKNHQRHPYMHDQMHFADVTGDAVIISAGEDGEMVFTRKPAGEGYLISTNFNVANPSNGFGYPCWRYDRAQELLEQLISKEEELTIEDATSVMDAVHEEGGSSWTIETMVADLVSGLIYIYYFYQYDSPVVIDVKEELVNPREAGPLSSLFPDDVKQEAAKRFKKGQAQMKINRITGISWTAIILVSLTLFLVLYSGDKTGFRFWIPAVVILGPVALLVMLIVRKDIKSSSWRKALVETTGNLIPTVVIYTFSLIFLAIVTINRGAGQLFQLLMMFGLPLFGGWLIFHGPVLGLLDNKNSCRFLIKRLPQVLVITLLGLGGIFPVSMPLVNRSLNISQLMPLSPWIVMTFWAIVVLGSLLGGFLIFLYESWAVKRGAQAWIILAGNDVEVVTPSLRKIWWWILISIIILLVGVIAGAVLSQLLV